jgi:dicarboxylate/amino acid:cation (Na+ or H+) symporter, DAACS family
VTLVNIFKPGQGFSIDGERMLDVSSIQKNASAAKSLPDTILSLIPRNPIEAAAQAFNGEIVAFMVFCLIFGLALSMSSVREKAKDVAIPLLEQIYGASMKVIDWAMAYAPIGVFALVATTAFKHGYGVFASLIGYVAVVVVGLLIQQFVVYSALLKVFTKTSPWEFFKKCKDVYLYAFSTASSNATLPKALHTAEAVLHQPSHVSRFVLTVGSTANQNGTALFEGVTVLFLAQVYNLDLSFAQQVQVVLMSILAGIGTAGVPGGSLPLIMILMSSVGIPAEGLGLVLGVDRFLDMCRTTLNVSGDLVISELVSQRAKPENPAHRKPSPA